MIEKVAYLQKKAFDQILDSGKKKVKGIYAITFRKNLDAMVRTGYLEVGVGDAGMKKDDQGDIASRMNGFITSKQLRKDLMPIGIWTDLEHIKRDHDIRDDLGLIAPRIIDTNKAGNLLKTELHKLPIAKAMIEAYKNDGEYEDIINYAHDQVAKVIKKHEKSTKVDVIDFREVQIKVLDRMIKKLASQGFDMSIVAELCPRIGKTIIFLELFKRINKKDPKFKTMLVKAYGVGLSIFKSYKDEVDKWKDFKDMDIIDSSKDGAEEQFKKSQKAGRLQVVLVSLNPEEDNRRYRWINQYKGSVFSLLEETDFGAHTEKQIKKIEFINANKKLVRINASGTNIGRLQKAMGDVSVEDIVIVPYSEVERDPDADRHGIVRRKYYNATFDHRINKFIEGYDEEHRPTIKAIIEKAWEQEVFLGTLWADILSSATAKVRYGMGLNQMAGTDLNYIMCFQTGTKKSMDEHKAVIEKYCPEVYVLTLHGDVAGMTNKTAEQLTKEKIVELKHNMIPGKKKLLVLTNMMGSRSYTVGQIEAVVFLQDGGDTDTFIQKASRVLSPFPGKKYGHIFDFAFDPNKTRNTELAIVHDVVVEQSNSGDDWNKCLRRVLSKLNLYDELKGGWLNDDQMCRLLEGNNKLLALANQKKIDIKKAPKELIDILMKLPITNKKDKKKLKQIQTGKTFVGKGAGVDRKQIDYILSQIKKAINSLNASATTVYWFANKKADNFKDAIDQIEKCDESKRDFEKVMGISSTDIKKLMPLLPLNIYDICVKNSANGHGQKYATNRALGILGDKDDPELWDEIISRPILDAKIRYAMRNNGKILIVAGGQGGELDVLVEKYGKGIIEHIWFNENIISFVNEIKNRYNKIKILKGNYLDLNIDMKFTVILENPPYQSQKESTGDDIWPAFVEKSLSLLEDDGIVASITPNTWLRRQGGDDKFSESLDYYGQPLPKRTNPVWKVWLENKVSNAKILTQEEADKYFPGVGSTFTYYFIEKKKPTDTKIDIEKGNNKIKIDLNSAYSPPNELNDISMSLHEKLLKAEKYNWIRTTENRKDNLERYKQLSDSKTKKHGNKIYMGVNLIRYTGKKMKYFDDAKIMVPITGQPKDIFVDNKCGVSQDLSFLCFDNKKEADKELATWNRNKLIQYIFKAYKVGKHISAHLMIPKNVDNITLSKKEKDYISNFINEK